MYITSNERTHNPNSWKFTINYRFMDDDIWECADPEHASESFLAEKLWASSKAILRVFFHEDIIVVHKSDNVTWDVLLPGIMRAIEDHFASQMPLFKSSREGSDDELKDETVKLICDVIKDYIEPGVRDHGGFIRFRDLKDDVVYISMHGACAGCSSATQTLKGGIEGIIRFYVPGINSVELI